MKRDQDQRVTILGAGIVGLCTALSLEKAGIAVQLIDSAAPGQGTSFGNDGVISPWSVVPQSVPGIWRHLPGWLLKVDGPVTVRPAYFPKLLPWAMRFLDAGKIARVRDISNAMMAMNQSNVALYKDILRGTGEESLIRDSYYVHAFREPEKANINGLEYSIRRDKGAQLQQIDDAELHALEPALSKQFKTAILIKNQARTLSPGRISQVIADQLKGFQTPIIQNRVVSIYPHHSNVWNIQTDTGLLQSSKVVIAMGAWSAELLKPLGINIPLEAERGYHAEFGNTKLSLTHSVMDMDLKMVASSMENGIRIAGTAEFAGLDYPANNKRITRLVAMAKNMLPGLGDNQPSTWMGSRPSLPDSLPCIGEIAGHSGLYAAFGHSHYGLMMAPRTGQIITDLISGNTIDIDLKPFRTDRF